MRRAMSNDDNAGLKRIGPKDSVTERLKAE
jgi:hypothetical protein